MWGGCFRACVCVIRILHFISLASWITILPHSLHLSFFKKQFEIWTFLICWWVLLWVWFKFYYSKIKFSKLAFVNSLWNCFSFDNLFVETLRPWEPEERPILLQYIQCSLIYMQSWKVEASWYAHRITFWFFSSLKTLLIL